MFIICILNYVFVFSVYADADGLGQASASLAGGRLELLTRRMKLQRSQAGHSQAQGQETREEADEGCSCRCLPYLRAYREDLGICVDDIHGKLVKMNYGSVFLFQPK